MHTQVKKFQLSNTQIYHALRVTLAVGFTLICYQFIRIPHSLWGPVTVIVVMMQPHTGIILNKSLQRISGTLIGAILGFIGALLSQYWLGYSGIWILAWCFILSLKSNDDYSYIFLIASATLIIVSYQDNTDQELTVALWRITNILIGSFVAVVFSLALPVRDKQSWQTLLKENVHDFSRLYKAHISKNQGNIDIKDVLKKQINQRQSNMLNLLPNAQKENIHLVGNYKKVMLIQVTMMSLIELLIELPWRQTINGQESLNGIQLKKYQENIINNFKKILDNKSLDVALMKLKPIKNMKHKISSCEDSEIIALCGYMGLTEQLMHCLYELNTQLIYIDKDR